MLKQKNEKSLAHPTQRITGNYRILRAGKIVFHMDEPPVGYPLHVVSLDIVYMQLTLTN